MDINALVSRDKAYYNSLVDSGRLTMYLPELDLNLVATAAVDASESGSVVTLTAPFSPTTNSQVSQIQVLEKSLSEPLSYSVVWQTPSSALLTPHPESLGVGELVKIGESIYEVLSKTGSLVEFTTPVSEVSVFYATVATPEVTYQWQLSEDGGVTWVDIEGATSRSYEATSQDVGDDLRVIISYVDGQGTIEQPSLAPPSTQPQTVYPVFPVIADIELDVVRQYAANLLTELIVTITSI